MTFTEKEIKNLYSSEMNYFCDYCKTAFPLNEINSTVDKLICEECEKIEKEFKEL